MRLYLLLALLALPFFASATHIVGGDLTYDYNGGSSYTITLSLYRDCGTGSAAFPGTVTINVTGYNGDAFSPSKDFNMTLGTVTNVPSNLESCAIAPNPTPCVQKGVYTVTVTNLPPNPGGYHLYYSVCCRNLSTTNVDASCNCIGANIYANIPGYTPAWYENFTLANGTTVDAGVTAWSRSLGAIPPTSAQVNNNLFEVIGANNGSITWTSQVINIAPYTSGVIVGVNLMEAGNMDAGDSIKVYYSKNGGPWVQFAGIADDFTTATASSPVQIGNTMQIRIRTRSDNNSPTSEIYRFDNVTVSVNDFKSNSNPDFTTFPPLFLCAGNPFSFDHAATDADGDALVYSLYAPYTDVAPSYPSNTATFTPVTYQSGYSAANPLGGTPVALNASTGMLTGTPTQLGQFAVGVKVQEYRNSVLLSEMTREFQFNVVICPVPAQAGITASGTLSACTGQAFTFPNSSSATANNWTWDFGDPSTLADISTQQFPSYTYAAPGTYTVRQIVNQGTSCADTATATVTVGAGTTWTGAVSTDWFASGNWSGCVPTGAVDALIPGSLSRYPVLTAGTAEVKSLTQNGSLTLSGGSLNLYGDFLGSGAFSHTSGTFALTGTGDQQLRGVTYGNLIVNGAGTKSLSGDATVTGTLTLTNGILDTETDTLTLGAAAALTETAAYYVLGTVQTLRTVGTAPESFGNIGFTMDAAIAPGLTTVTRVTGQVQTGTNSSESIARYYDIHPAVNANLNADISFRYSEAELNSIAETDLIFFRSTNNGLTWTSEGYGTRNAAANTITLSGVNAFSRWTLGSQLDPLPVELSSFAARKQGTAALLEWTTAQELNVAFYKVEGSRDGRSFTRLAVIEPQHSTSVTGSRYAWLDQSPDRSVLNYYRLSQTDLDGTVHHLGIRSVRFDEQQPALAVTPNPFHHRFMAQIKAASSGQASLLLYDALGRLAEEKQVVLQSGENQIDFILGEQWPAGMYMLQIHWNGQTEHSLLIKQ